MKKFTNYIATGCMALIVVMGLVQTASALWYRGPNNLYRYNEPPISPNYYGGGYSHGGAVGVGARYHPELNSEPTPVEYKYLQPGVKHGTNVIIHHPMHRTFSYP